MWLKEKTYRSKTFPSIQRQTMSDEAFEFSLNIAQFSEYTSVVTIKGFEPATSCVRDMIFKLTPIHAQVIYHILWIHRISVLFRENSIEEWHMWCVSMSLIH